MPSCQRRLTFLAWIVVTMAHAGDAPLARLEALMSTPRAEAAKRPVVRVRGVVSMVGEGLAGEEKKKEQVLSSFCMEDETGGIWVSVSQAIREGIWNGDKEVLFELEEGTEIEVDGVLDEGSFAPVILPSGVRVVGKKTLSAAQEVPLAKLMRGAADVQRVRVSGVVQSIADEAGRRWLLKVETGLGHFLARLPKTEVFAPGRLLDAEVQMTGVAAVSRNWRSEFVCPRLVISRAEDVVILTAAPEDPFAAEKVPLDALDAFAPQGRPLHRRRIEGVVTYSDASGFLFMQSGLYAVRVEMVDAEGFALGDRVEASGFIDTSRSVAGLTGALVRKLGREVLPEPVPMRLSGIEADFALMKKGQKGRLPGCDGLLISITGRLLNVQSAGSDGVQRLEMDCGDAVSTVFAPADVGDLLPGTELRAAGIASVQYAPAGQTANFAEPVRLDLLLRDRSDLEVLRVPTWWTLRRMLYALFGLGLVALGVLVWAVVLRRTVAKQTRLLAQEMRGRRDAAVEFQAALRERTRLAANLHDTVLQTMTGLAYQIEACEAESVPEVERSANHLETARRMVQRGQEDLRNAVWALRALPMKERTFAEAVRSVAKQVSAGHAVEIVVEEVNELPEIVDFIAGNLLLVVQEAVHNAVKHAKPKRIAITLSASADATRVFAEVRDDGVGFVPGSQPGTAEGHFGMEGMRERVERLGGTLEMESSPGGGTRLSVEVPLRFFDHELV